MAATNLQTGKVGELWVFGKLVDGGSKVYLPLVDEEGVDAIVRGNDQKLREIQVKSTRAPDQAGYFNAYVRPRCTLFIVCVDLSPLDRNGVQPEVWIFPSDVFTDPAYSAKQKSGEYRLALPARRRSDRMPRKELLKEFREAWHLLTGP